MTEATRLTNEAQTTPVVSDIDIEQARRVLASLQPGFLPLPIFLEVSRLVPMDTVEVVPIRQDSDGNVSILLTQRDDNDPFWANMWHTPGSVSLATDKPAGYSDEIKRVLDGEIKGVTVIGEPVFTRVDIRDTKRGREHAALHYVEVVGGSPVGQFFPIDALPDSTMEHQVAFIHELADLFKQNRQL